ncbi:hypothetical protein HDU84_001956 [Entophlyctis sp. JEL0112]|nr:hypothetical protein HDU84_001956 [Entophlyctis sp. JEL0112]
MNTRWLAITNNENLRFVNLRLTLYKAVNDVGACIPHKKSDPVLYHNSGSFYVKSFTAIKKFVPDFQSSVFTNSEDILKYVDPSMLPMDFGGTVTEEQLEADIEDFIKRQYAIEGLTYSPIDIKNINWKTYRPSGMDFSVRPESAISVKSIDYDAIDAELEAQGYKEEDAAVVE